MDTPKKKTSRAERKSRLRRSFVDALREVKEQKEEAEKAKKNVK